MKESIVFEEYDTLEKKLFVKRGKNEMKNSFEIKNGILGIQRYLVCQIIQKIGILETKKVKEVR
jgi:hypothetical protein